MSKPESQPMSNDPVSQQILVSSSNAHSMLVPSITSQNPASTVSEPNTYLAPISTHFTASADRPADGFTGVPLTSFTCFPKLPAELRCMVWRMTFPGPRIVIVQRHHQSNGIHKLVSTARVPIALRVNSESRAEALKVYTITFAYHAPGGSRCSEPEIAFDFNVDFLTWDAFKYHDGLKRETCSAVAHYISQEGKDRVRLITLPEKLAYGIFTFSNLDVLRQLVDDAELKWWSDAGFKVEANLAYMWEDFTSRAKDQWPFTSLLYPWNFSDVISQPIFEITNITDIDPETRKAAEKLRREGGWSEGGRGGIYQYFPRAW